MIPESRFLFLVWLIRIMVCTAAPLQQVTTENALCRDSFDTTNHAQALRTLRGRHLEYRVNPHNVRRGSGGSVAASVALGSFQLETKLFKTFTTIVPSKLAGRYITDFLDIIALRIETGFWSHEPPANQRVIRLWDFELSFYSLNTAIPWDFIQAYVLDMEDDIARGFVGTFDEYMIGMINGVATAVTVRLKMMRQDPPMITM